MASEARSARGRAAIWFDAAAVCGGWLAIVRPWTDEPASPLAVAIASALATFLLVLWRRLALAPESSADLRGRYRIFQDLAVAFGIMAAVGLLFTMTNLYLEAEAGAAGGSVRQVLDLQAKAVELEAWAERLEIAAKFGALCLMLGLFLLALGAGKTFDRLFKARDWLERSLRILMLATLCVGSFSLSAGELAGGLADRRARAAFALAERTNESLATLDAAVRRELASLVAERLHETSHVECGQSAECNSDPLVSLDSELYRVRRWQQSWPPRPARYGLPAEPTSSALFREAARTDALIDSLPMRMPASPRIAAAVQDQPIAALEAAADAMPGDITPPDRKRVQDLVALAISVGLDTAGVGIAPNVDETLGRFVSKIAGTITGSMQSRLEAVIRGVAVDIVAACRGGARACSEAARRRLRAVRDDPRARQVAQRLANPATAAMRRLVETAQSVRTLDAASERSLERALLAVEQGEREGPWGRLRHHWLAQLRSGGVGLTRVQREGWLNFAETWEDYRRQEARQMLSAGQAGTPEQWDREFLEYTRAHADAAAIVGYWIVNYPEIHRFIAARQPGFREAEITAIDGYLLFAATVERRSWSPDIALARDIPDLAAFQQAYLRYCPRAAQQGGGA